MIRVKDLSFSYGKKAHILKAVSFSVSGGKILGIIGPNGAGKSTLIRCMNRIHTPRKGRILLKGRAIESYSRKEIAKLIGYVPQKLNAAFPCKVLEVVMTGLGKTWGRSAAMRQAERALQALGRLHMEEMAMRDFEALSGGEQQKVVIARVIASQAEIMLFDEPTSNLDMRYQFETLRLIEDIVKNRGRSAVIAIHDLNMALRYCDRILLLDRGRVKAFGRPEEVMKKETIREVYGIDIGFVRKDNRNIMILEDAV